MTAISKQCMKLGLAALAAVNGAAFATEGGGSIYPNGAESFLVGALPPPGVYTLMYLSGYSASTLRDSHGGRVPVSFDLDVSAVVPRIVWVTGRQVLGGQVVAHAILPLLHESVVVNGAGATRSGIGDATVGMGLGYHVSDRLHYVVAVDLNAPTGAYDRNASLNLGRNYWNIEPMVAISYVRPDGLNADIKVMYDFNARNRSTGYRSGQEFHADYTVGWSVAPSLVVGLGGYVYKQTTDDKLHGAVVADRRGAAVSVGPSLKFDNGKGLIVTAKYAREFRVRNRPEGNGLNVKAILPF